MNKVCKEVFLVCRIIAGVVEQSRNAGPYLVTRKETFSAALHKAVKKKEDFNIGGNLSLVELHHVMCRKLFVVSVASI